MSRGPEGKIQDAVVRYAREKYNALCKKFEVGRYFISSGWPDWLMLRDRRAWFIEFKRPGGVLTALQAQVRKEIEEQGFRYYVVDDIVQGKRIIDKECA